MYDITLDHKPPRLTTEKKTGNSITDIHQSRARDFELSRLAGRRKKRKKEREREEKEIRKKIK